MSALPVSSKLIPLEARYLSVSDWKFESKDENVNDAYMKVAQSIILREGININNKNRS